MVGSTIPYSPFEYAVTQPKLNAMRYRYGVGSNFITGAPPEFKDLVTLRFCMKPKHNDACTIHSLAWDDPKDKKDAHNPIRASTPGQVIDLPKPPDHIIVDINPIKGIEWPHHLDLSSNPKLI